MHQAGAGGLIVEITQPTCTTLIVIGHMRDQAAVRAWHCNALSNFQVKATITNTGDANVINIYATASASPISGWVDDNQSPIWPIYPRTRRIPGSDFITRACIGVGDGNITVNASGYNTGSSSGVDATPAVVAIAQKNAIAQLSPDPLYATPAVVNKCQEFDVTFRYYNYTGTGMELSTGTHGQYHSLHNWEGLRMRSF